MTNLLTHAEYSAIAEALDPPRSPFIDGKYQRGNGPMMATVSYTHLTLPTILLV